MCVISVIRINDLVNWIFRSVVLELLINERCVFVTIVVFEKSEG